MSLKKYGGYVRICEDYHGQPWLTLGPDRLICFICLLTVNIVSLFLLLLLNQSESGYNFFLVHIVILIYLDIVWVAGGCINPGIVLERDDDDEECPKCQENEEEVPDFTNHDNSITHCNECQICIRQRGHHCHLLGTCVGKNNKIIYYFYLLGLSLWVIDVASTAPYVYYMM